MKKFLFTCFLFGCEYLANPRSNGQETSFPKREVVVGASDLVELEEEYQELIKKDDKTIVCKRQANRVFLNIRTTPRSSECYLRFTLSVRRQSTETAKNINLALCIHLSYVN